VTAQRRRHTRAKQENRRTRGPREAETRVGTTRGSAFCRIDGEVDWSAAADTPRVRGSARRRLHRGDAAPWTGTRAPGSSPAEPSLLERAERLRDDLLRSKLTHPDPWSYTAKARAWAERAQTLVQDIAIASQTPELHAMVAKLAAEVENDPDYQKARQLF
jgi:hypothetical protein